MFAKGDRMVIDPLSNYTSPAGREFTLSSGRIAGVNPGSKVLDMGCGYGEGACTMASEFRCSVTAIDISQENIDLAQQYAIQKNVSHLIEFIHANITDLDFTEKPFDCVLAEGGILSFIGRQQGIQLAHAWLRSRGWFAFSDLILLSETLPSEVSEIFEHKRFKYETEDSYRMILSKAGFDIQLLTLVPKSGWDNYYAHMARRLEDETGFFADKKIKLAFHKEIDAFYRLEIWKYVGYAFCLARKKY